MYQHIGQFFETEFPLNRDGVKELFAGFRLERYPKGTVLLEAGRKETELRFLNSGMVREYFAADAEEMNIYFYTRPDFLSDWSSLVNELPTRRYQQALSTVEVLVQEREQLVKLLERYSCGRDFMYGIFRRKLEQKEAEEFLRKTQSPEAHYQYLMEQRPDWLLSLPQYHIASYLNIKPETLSRIRKRIS